MIIWRFAISAMFLGGLFWGSLFSYAEAYNPDKTHYPLSEHAVELYNQFYPKQQFSEQEKQWIAQGSIDEDTPALRVIHHFYDPINNTGLQGFESSKKWIHDAALQSLNRFQIGPPKNNFGIFTWEEAIKAYEE